VDLPYNLIEVPPVSLQGFLLGLNKKRRNEKKQEKGVKSPTAEEK